MEQMGRECQGKWAVNAKGDKNVQKMEYTKSHGVAYFKWVNCIGSELYPHKTVVKNDYSQSHTKHICQAASFKSFD